MVAWSSSVLEISTLSDIFTWGSKNLLKPLRRISVGKMVGSQLLDAVCVRISGLIGVIEIPGPYIKLFRMEVSKNLKKKLVS